MVGFAGVSQQWFEQILETSGFDVFSAADPDDAVRCLQTADVDALILEFSLPTTRSGLEVLEFVRCRAGDSRLPILIRSGESALSEEEEGRIRKHRAYVFYKAESVDAMIAQLERLIPAPSIGAALL